jgi:predicted phage-related endonuclease
VQSEWEKALPQDVETQVRWQLMVTGLDHAHVAALIGGQRMVEHRVDRDAEKEQELLTAAKIVWDAVVDKMPPNLPAELWTSDFLEQRHPDRTGEIEVDEQAAKTVADYNAINDEIKLLEAEKARIRTALIGALGEYEVAIHNGKRIFSYKASTRRTLDSKAVIAKIPDIEADETLWKTTTSRTLWAATIKEGTTNE